MAGVVQTSCASLAVGVRGPHHTRRRIRGMTNDKAHALLILVLSEGI